MTRSQAKALVAFTIFLTVLMVAGYALGAGWCIMNGLHFKALDTNSKTIGLFLRMTFGEALTLTEAEVSEITKAIATIESGADKLLSLFRQAEQRYELKTDKSTHPKYADTALASGVQTAEERRGKETPKPSNCEICGDDPPIIRGHESGKHAHCNHC